MTGIVGLLQTLSPGASASTTVSAIVSVARQANALLGKVSAGGIASAPGAIAAMQLGQGGSSGGNSGSGNGGNGNGGNGNGNGKQTPGFRDQHKGGVKKNPPPTLKAAPAVSMPNLDQLRKLKPSSAPPSSNTSIHSNMMCSDCDLGGFGGYQPANDARYSRPRTLPINQTGQQGVDLGSRNFNWSASLVSLLGRAGLNLNIALTYNSLVWTKESPGIKYDAGRGFPGPGFHLGFASSSVAWARSHITRIRL